MSTQKVSELVVGQVVAVREPKMGGGCMYGKLRITCSEAQGKSWRLAGELTYDTGVVRPYDCRMISSLLVSQL